MQNHWPIILVEGVMVFGGALAFGWWQLRSIRMDREKAALLKAEELAKGLAEETADTSAEEPQAGSPPPLTARSADLAGGKLYPPPR